MPAPQPSGHSLSAATRPSRVTRRKSTIVAERDPEDIYGGYAMQEGADEQSGRKPCVPGPGARPRNQ